MNTQLPSPSDPPEEPEELEAIARLLSPGGAGAPPGEPEESEDKGEPPREERTRRRKQASSETADEPKPRRAKRPRAIDPQALSTDEEPRRAKRRRSAQEAEAPREKKIGTRKVVRKRRRVAKESGRAPSKTPPLPGMDPQEPAAGHRIAGRFEIAGPLGEGPNGRVFRTRDHEHSGRSTALKILHARHARATDFGERLDALREARSRLRSDTVNRLRQVGRTDLGLYYLATDPVAGENLRTLLDRRGPLHARQAFEIVRQVARGLEEGHAIGLVHGAVHDHNVFLLERIPSSDANPFGVGIRLTDFGLAGLFAEEASQPSVHDDLRELGWLLVELLSGTRPDPQGQGWEAGAAAKLSPEGSSFVARCIGAENPFGSAVALRNALELLPDWKGEEAALTRWRRVALGGIAATTVLSGYLLWTAFQTHEVEAAAPGDASPGNPGDAVETAELHRLRTELARTERDLEEARATAQAATASEAAERLRSENAQREQERANERIADLRSELDTAEEDRAELERTRARIAELQGDLETWQLRARNVEEERDAERRARDPNWQAAAGLDLILDAIATSGATAARVELERLRTSSPFASTGFPGDRFLTPWLEAAEKAQEAALEPDALRSAASLLAGEKALAEANAERAEFESGGESWLGLGDVEREEAIDRSLRTISIVLQSTRGALEPRLASAWHEVRTPTLDLAPEAVLPLARWFDDQRLGPWVDRYATLALQASAQADELDLEALGRIEHLDAWADALPNEPTVAERFATDEIRLLRYAHRFHDPDFVNEALPPFAVRHQGPGGGSPVSGWRAALELKARLAAGELPYPAPIGTRSVWVTRTPEGNTSYVVETVQLDDAPPKDATRSRIVEQRFYDSAGEKRGDRRIRVVQRGKRFYEEGVRQTLILDLSRPSAFEVRYWTPRKEASTPERLPVHAEAIARFHKGLLERGWRTLVRIDGTRTAWFSPELGFVRDAEPGRIERELMLLELPPPGPGDERTPNESR